MSYSCGKDSTLALHKAIAAGHIPLALLVMFNPEADRSYFHGADRAILARYAEALQIPLLPIPTAGETYHLAMEDALRQARQEGAAFACFGDIDIAENRAWGEARCANAGIGAYYPLWQRNREENVRELIELGYQCVIKSLNHTLLPRTLLGRILDASVLEEMARHHVDLCGENGEYHTLVVDGPIFHTPLPYQTGEILDVGDFSICNIT